MDMTEKKKETIWVFPDSPELPIHGIFLDCQNEISKNGANSFPVINLDSAGIKIKVSKWKTNYTECIKKFGGNSELWKNKSVALKLDDKNKLCLVPLEQDIQ